MYAYISSRKQQQCVNEAVANSTVAIEERSGGGWMWMWIDGRIDMGWVDEKDGKGFTTLNADLANHSDVNVNAFGSSIDFSSRKSNTVNLEEQIFSRILRPICG
ncbi:hypothetical protein CHUAL_009210 [Chamberlinius hualienensis]